VRCALETAVNSEAEPLEEGLRAQIVDLVEEAQNRAFSAYRALQQTPSLQMSSGDIGTKPNNPSGSLKLAAPSLPDEYGLALNQNRTADSGYASTHSDSGSSSSQVGKIIKRKPALADIHYSLGFAEALVTPDPPSNNSWTTAAFDAELDSFNWEAWNAEI
jgi:hypothetical protein